MALGTRHLWWTLACMVPLSLCCAVSTCPHPAHVRLRCGEAAVEQHLYAPLPAFPALQIGPQLWRYDLYVLVEVHHLICLAPPMRRAIQG